MLRQMPVHSPIAADKARRPKMRSVPVYVNAAEVMAINATPAAPPHSIRLPHL